MLLKIINNRKFTFILCILTMLYLCGNSQTVKFSYDDAGNRVKREMIIVENIDVKDEDVKQFLFQDQESFNLDIAITPDQNRGQIHIDFKNEPMLEEYMIALFHIAGYKVFNIRPQKSISDIDMSNLPNGTYVLVISSQSKAKSWKILYSR